MRFRKKKVKSDYHLWHVFLYVLMKPLGSTRRTSMIFIFEYFFENLSKNSSFIKIWQELQALYLKNNIHLTLYLSQFFLEWEMLQTRVAEEIKTHILYFITYFRKSCRLWDNMDKIQFHRVRRATDDNIIRRMRITCWMPKARGSGSESGILTAFPLQQWLHECASMLRYTYIACLVKN